MPELSLVKKVNKVVKKQISVLVGTLFSTLLSCSVFAAEQDNKIIKNYLIQNDLVAWLGSGKSLIDWSNIINKDGLISSNAITPPQLYFEFDSNVYSAEEKFNKVPQIVNGIVYSVKKDTLGSPVVTFLTDSYVDNFIASGFDESEVAHFYKGGKVDFVCYQFTLDNFILHSEKCTLKANYINEVAINVVNDLSESNALNNIFSNNPKIFNKINVAIDKLSNDQLKGINTTCKMDNYFQDKQCVDLIVNSLRK